ncbi:DNA gyrase inhibitor YacG [Brevundimonas sp.]|uniref:DNA gyrase inhibitor YacG n=1 Tax=Brevundimonas sp. TaxID=1871086 RepID=UPI002FC986C6
MMAKCPICRRNEAEAQYKPFCSRRCADVDLQRWFSGSYAIPAEEVEFDEKDRGIE